MTAPAFDEVAAGLERIHLSLLERHKSNLVADAVVLQQTQMIVEQLTLLRRDGVQEICKELQELRLEVRSLSARLANG
jgi:hypothetical protein